MSNKVITMFYELKDAKSGEILESNMTNGGISFITGHGHIIPKLEEELLKLKAGDRTSITIPAVEACGEYDSQAVQSLPKEQFAGIELREGMELFGQGEDGGSVRVTVKAIGESEVMIDFNHPYAGKDLSFSVEILDIREPSEDEMATGMVGGAHSCGCGGHDHGNGGCCGGHGHNHHGDGGCGCGGHGHSHDDEDECCGGAHHENGGCCGKHH